MNRISRRGALGMMQRLARELARAEVTAVFAYIRAGGVAIAFMACSPWRELTIEDALQHEHVAKVIKELTIRYRRLNDEDGAQVHALLIGFVQQQGSDVQEYPGADFDPKYNRRFLAVMLRRQGDLLHRDIKRGINQVKMRPGDDLYIDPRDYDATKDENAHKPRPEWSS